MKISRCHITSPEKKNHPMVKSLEFDEFDQGIVVTSPEKVSGGEQISSFLLGDGEKLGMLFIIYIYKYIIYIP